MGWFSADSSSAAQTQEVTSADGIYKPLKRNERTACWEARDVYFNCLDRNNILDAVKDSDSAIKYCNSENSLFEKDCATSWVLYFKQKRVADFNKAQQLKKLEAEGAVPIAQGQAESKWRLW